MNDSMAQARLGVSPRELARWKNGASGAAAVLLALLFLSSGLWKITGIEAWAMRLAQARVPESLSVAGALVFGVAETLAGMLLLVPRLRRWGAILSAVLLIAFVTYFAVNYGALRGQDCSCFPWIRRVVGPGFFAGDAAMLVLAAMAWVWAPRPTGFRAAALIFAAVAVFALVSYGVEAVRQTGTEAPASIVVDGRPVSLAHGRFFLFFFNPQCMHCLDAARRMSGFHWGDTQVIAIPVDQPQFAQQFLSESGLRAAVSSDFELLKRTFGYSTYPFGVALVDGREKAPVTRFDGDEPGASLRRLGLIN
jgi:uncharacterized membrane protein YphA (DoxX/SURF4 family)